MVAEIEYLRILPRMRHGTFSSIKGLAMVYSECLTFARKPKPEVSVATMLLRVTSGCIEQPLVFSGAGPAQTVSYASILLSNMNFTKFSTKRCAFLMTEYLPKVYCTERCAVRRGLKTAMSQWRATLED